MDDDAEWGDENQPVDPIEPIARAQLRQHFDDNPRDVFYVRQLEVLYERKFFHWVTSRVLGQIRGDLKVQTVKLDTKTDVKLMWHRQFRYSRRRAAKVVSLINQYSDPFVCELVGERGEELVLDGFANAGFRQIARHVNEHEGARWTETNHNLDFIFERDGRRYGVEVKNTLQYMEESEFRLKLRMCDSLGIAPVFAVRMLPRTWINEIRIAGGYAMIMEWQMYPRALRELALEIRTELGLPVDIPRHLKDTTVGKLLKYFGHV